MPNHLSDAEIDRYRNRRSPAQELLRVDDHAHDCAPCRKRLAEDYDIESALVPDSLNVTVHAADGASQHLAYEQMEAYVNRTLPGIQMSDVQAHIQVCRICELEVRDLESFKQELQQPTPVSRSGIGRPPRAILLRRAAGVAALGFTALLVYLWQVRGAPERNSVDVAQVHRGEPTVPFADSRAITGTDGLPSSARLAIAKAIESGEIDFPAALAELRGPAQNLLGPSDDRRRFAVLAPVGEVVFDPRPHFRWEQVQGAVSYSVAIFDAELHVVQRSSALHVTEWQPPMPLTRGRSYQWQVTATLKNGETVISPRPPSGEAKFQILEQPTADELESLQRMHPHAHVALGILYARAGLLTDADRELAQVSHNDPHYKTTQGLLEVIRSARSPDR